MPKFQVVEKRQPAPAYGAVTLAEIDAVKRSFVERNLSFTPEEAGALFSRSGRWALGKVKDGTFIALDGDARTGEDGFLQASRFIRITAESVEAYRRSIVIDPEKWGE